MKLFDYQEDVVQRVSEAFEEHKRVLLCMSVGAGKTNTGLAIAKRAHRSGAQVIWLTHRRDLVQQTYDRIGAVGGSASVIMAGNSVRAPDAFITIASIDTVTARSVTLRPDLIICDEAHRSVTAKWTQILNRYPESYILGLTATPSRADETGLGDVYQYMVCGPSEEELIRLGRLVPCELSCPARYCDALAEDPLHAWKQRFTDESGIIFASTVKHAKTIASSFRDAGIPAVSYTAETPFADRETYLKSFRAGGLKVLVSVNVFTEGFDAPRASVAIIARGCSSLTAWRQMAGRILRTYPGKEKGYLLDLRGSAHLWGHPTSPVDWTLEGKGYRKPEPNVRQCLQCGLAWYPPPDACSRCGWVPKTRRVKKKDTVKSTPLFTMTKTQLQSAREEAKRLTQIARERKYKMTWVGITFKNRFGFWPPKGWLT